MGYIGNQSAGITYTNINTFRGKVANLTALNAVSGMENGDLYLTEDNNHAHMYTGTAWVDLGKITGPAGPVGPKGIAGASVSTVVRTTGDGSAGTTDVYTITYSDATTSTFNVYNGKDGMPGTINHIKRTAGTGAAGTTDTYTAYADVAETQLLGTFNVYNGHDGVASTVDSLVDVDLTTVPVEDGQTIVWNNVKGKWLPGDVSSSAINTTYDNTTSGLTATYVQGAIDEIENSAVKLTGNQTIAGVKTFSSSPIVPTPTTDTQAVNKKYVDDKTSTEAYQGSYGLEWNETTDTYRRIGAANYTAIQSMMRRCVLNSDGSINYYLDKNNSNLKEDGTLAKLDGTDGNVMVQVPKTYVRYEYITIGGAGTDIVHRWEISLEPETGFEAHWAFDRGGAIMDKRYYPAYLGYVTGGKMISRSGVYPTVNQTLAQLRTAAKANSISNPSSGQTVNGYWGNIDFALYELIALYAVIEYGTMNIQSALGRGRTSLSGGAWVGGELIGVNGLSNEYGNITANYTYVGASTDAAADLSFMSYRGCENFFGNVWRMADGVIFKGTTPNKTMWYSTTPTEYNETGTGYTNSGIVTAAASGYGRKLANTNKGFIVSDVTGGNSNAGTTDYYYTSTTDNTVALVGGSSNLGLNTGPLDLSVNDSAASLSFANVGCGVSF